MRLLERAWLRFGHLIISSNLARININNGKREKKGRALGDAAGPSPRDKAGGTCLPYFAYSAPHLAAARAYLAGEEHLRIGALHLFLAAQNLSCWAFLATIPAA